MKRLKMILCCALVLTMLSSVMCVTHAEYRDDMDFEPYAKALDHLGLFKGTDNGYDLYSSLTREQALTVIVRLMGAEEEALEKNYQHPFKDVSSWAQPYVGYAYANWITSGIRVDYLGAQELVNEQQFLTFLLRLLGYEDGVDFVWNNPYTLACEAGLVLDAVPENAVFNRGDAVVLCWRALNAAFGGDAFLADSLIEQDVFTSKQFEEATAIVDPDAEPDKDNKDDQKDSSSDSTENDGSAEEPDENWPDYDYGDEDNNDSGSGNTNPGDSGSEDTTPDAPDQGGNNDSDTGEDNTNPDSGEDTGEPAPDEGGTENPTPDEGGSDDSTGDEGNNTTDENETEFIPFF